MALPAWGSRARAGEVRKLLDNIADRSKRWATLREVYRNTQHWACIGYFEFADTNRLSEYDELNPSLDEWFSEVAKGLSWAYEKRQNITVLDWFSRVWGRKDRVTPEREARFAAVCESALKTDPAIMLGWVAPFGDVNDPPDQQGWKIRTWQQMLRRNLSPDSLRALASEGPATYYGKVVTLQGQICSDGMIDALFRAVQAAALA